MHSIREENEFIRTLIERSPSCFDPKGDMPLVITKEGSFLTEKEILDLCMGDDENGQKD